MRKINLMFGLCLAFLFMGCENKLEMTLPQGPEGPQGEPGMSAFEYWKILNNLPGATADDFYESLRGPQGDMPYVTIGENGNWYINGEDTNKPSQGENAVAPEIIIGENGNWFIDGRDTEKPSQGKKGKDGITPEFDAKIIGGVWYVNGKSTGVKATGDKGDKGETGAQGDKGEDGVSPD